METIQLTEKGYKTVIDAMDNPRPVTDKLSEAAAMYKNAMKDWPDGDGKTEVTGP